MKEGKKEGEGGEVIEGMVRYHTGVFFLLLPSSSPPSCLTVKLLQAVMVRYR